MFNANVDVQLSSELLSSVARPIEVRKRIRFHIGTAEIMGYVVLLGQRTLEPGQSAFVQIRLEEPTFALPGDRFIIRQYSPMVTIGGGKILDADTGQTSSDRSDVIERLEFIRDGTVDEQLLAVIEGGGFKEDRLSGYPQDADLVPAGLGAVAGLVKAGRVVLLTENPFVVVATSAFKAAAEAAATAGEAFP